MNGEDQTEGGIKINAGGGWGAPPKITKRTRRQEGELPSLLDQGGQEMPRKAPESPADGLSLPERGPVEGGVLRDLSGLPEDVQASTLAASALTLARALDAGAGLSTAAIARELRAHMTELLAQREVKEERDPLDELVAIRERRRPAG